MRRVLILFQTEDGEVSFSKFAWYSLAGTIHRTESMDIIASTVADINACNVCVDFDAELECSFGYLFDVVGSSCFYNSVSYVLRAGDIPYVE